MSYERIRTKAWSHRAIVAAFMFAVALSTIAATTPSTSKPGNGPYKFSFTVEPHAGDALIFQFDIQGADGFHLSPEIRTSSGHTGTLRYEVVENDHKIAFLIRATGTVEAGSVELEVTDGGKVVQSQVTTYDKSARNPETPSRFTGERIELKLKKASLRDVMNTFADLTGYDVSVDRSAADTSITIDISKTPWDEALDIIARQNGLEITIEGKSIHVSKK